LIGEFTMTLTLYFHPLSSFCQKVLTALYENDTPFEKRLVNLGDAEDAAALKKLWPIGKFPVLRDDAKDRTIPESSIIIEYLDRNYPGKASLIPDDVALALEMRQADRFHDLCVQAPMQAIVGDRLRPKEARDPLGVEKAKSQLRVALDVLDEDLADKVWAIGDQFSMADCSAAPALYYADLLMPFADTHKNAAAYLGRLMQRASFARAVDEAGPYRRMFPQE
jgi:glutathione S-transferase